jgi:hypothetical protein
MKRSKAVTLSLVPMVASWFAACGGGSSAPAPTHQRICVDQNTRVLEDFDCEPNRRRSGGFYPIWMFAPYRGNGYPLGAALTNGTVTSPAGPGVSVAQGRVVRGVFGTSARSSAGA